MAELGGAIVEQDRPPAEGPPPTPEASAARVLEVVPALMRRIRRETRSAVAPALSVPQLRAMLFVRRHPETSLSALAGHLGVGLPTCSALVERLVRQGLLTRAAAPDERRRMMLTLTEAGGTELDRATGHTRREIAAALGVLSSEELASIDEALDLLRHAIVGDDAPPAIVVEGKAR